MLRNLVIVLFLSSCSYKEDTPRDPSAKQEVKASLPLRNTHDSSRIESGKKQDPFERADDPVPLHPQDDPLFTEEYGNFALREKISFAAAYEQGYCSRLFFRQQLIDTIDLYFDTHLIGGDSMVYLQAGGIPDTIMGATLMGGTGDLIMFTGKEKIILNSIVPYLNTRLAFPLIEGAILYHWGVSHSYETGRTTIYACEYNLVTGKSKNFPLYSEVFATGGFVFGKPQITGDHVVFSYRDENGNDKAHRFRRNND
jgi:hypothetical protein